MGAQPFARGILGQGIHRQHLGGQVRQSVQKVALAEHHRRLGVFHHEDETVRGVFHVQREVGGARLEHTPKGHHQIERALHGHTDHGFRAAAEVEEVLRHFRRALRQFPVGQAVLAKDHRLGLGRTVHLGVEEGDQGGFWAPGGQPGLFCVVPLHHHLLPRSGGHPGQVEQLSLRILGCTP